MLQLQVYPKAECTLVPGCVYRCNISLSHSQHCKWCANVWKAEWSMVLVLSACVSETCCEQGDLWQLNRSRSIMLGEGLGRSDVRTFWKLWAVIWFLFPISSLMFLPSPLPLFVLSFFLLWSIPLTFLVLVWSWRKNFSFHVTHVSVSQFCG